VEQAHALRLGPTRQSVRSPTARQKEMQVKKTVPKD